jgi:hypothetical protein
MDEKATKDNLLQRGIAALRGGDNLQARQLLGQAIRQDPGNEQAWLWLSGAMETTQDKLMCLNKVLAINPGNEAALRGLAALQTSPPASPTPAPPSPLETQPVPRPQHIRPSLVQSVLSGDQSTAESPPAPSSKATAASGQTAPPASFSWASALAPQSSQDTSHLINHTQTLEQMSPESRQALEGYVQLIIYELRNGKKQKEIVERLVKRGFPRMAVKQFVKETERRTRKARRKEHRRRRRVEGMRLAEPYIRKQLDKLLIQFVIYGVIAIFVLIMIIVIRIAGM